MHVALIAPIPNLSLTKQGDIHMCLTHLVLNNKEYCDFYKKEKRYKILDNGAFEGKLHSIEDVLKAADMINANEIILPDVIYNSSATLNAIYKALKVVPKRRYVLHAVVQGSREDEWWECLRRLQEMPEIGVIGLSKLSCPKAFDTNISSARLIIAMQLIKNDWWGNKKYHLLGGSNMVLWELFYQSKKIRSIDSGAPVEYGMKEQYLSELPPLSTKRFNFHKTWAPSTQHYINHNTKSLLTAAHNAGGTTK